MALTESKLLYGLEDFSLYANGTARSAFAMVKFNSVGTGTWTFMLHRDGIGGTFSVTNNSSISTMVAQIVSTLNASGNFGTSGTIRAHTAQQLGTDVLLITDNTTGISGNDTEATHFFRINDGDYEPTDYKCFNPTQSDAHSNFAGGCGATSNRKSWTNLQAGVVSWNTERTEQEFAVEDGTTRKTLLGHKLTVEFSISEVEFGEDYYFEDSDTYSLKLGFGSKEVEVLNNVDGGGSFFLKTNYADNKLKITAETTMPAVYSGSAVDIADIFTVT